MATAEIISCLEHTVLPIVEKRQPGQQALSKTEEAKLSKLEASLPVGAIRWVHKGVKFAQFCGVIQLDGLTLEILPKIHGKEADPGACREALVRMLYKARVFKSHKGGTANIQLQKHTLLDIFIIHFCEELKIQITQGRLRQYQAREENLPVLRGRLLVDQQFKYNAAHKERLYCRYDELTEDILINQVIKFTLRHILPQSRSDRARKLVGELLMMFDDISDCQISYQHLDQIQFDRTTVRYGAIVEQCKIFIMGMNPDVVAGNSKVFSLLFDMNRLFEAWVAAVLRPIAAKQGLRLREQGPRKFTCYREDIEKPVFQMRPDITLIDDNGDVRLIADAKWKHLDVGDAKLGVSQADVYQMQAYANRYGIDRLCLLYPCQQSLRDKYKFQVQGTFESALEVLTVDIGNRSNHPFPESFLSEF